MNKSKNINFIQMSNLSKKQALAKIKKSLLALGLKYKPKDSTKKRNSMADTETSEKEKEDIPVSPTEGKSELPFTSQ